MEICRDCWKERHEISKLASFKSNATKGSITQQIREIIIHVRMMGRGANICPHLKNVCWKILRLGRAISSASINHSENLGNFTNAIALLVQCRLEGSG